LVSTMRTRVTTDGATPANQDVERLMTAHEVAAVLQVARGWVYAATRRNEIPHVRLGRYVRYRRSAIEERMATIEQGRPGSAR
jgi:excisionase family DNA binding protein